VAAPSQDSPCDGPVTYPGNTKILVKSSKGRSGKKSINVLGKKSGSTEHSKGNKTVPEKVATTCTEDGHRQTTETNTTI